MKPSGVALGAPGCTCQPEPGALLILALFLSGRFRLALFCALVGEVSDLQPAHRRRASGGPIGTYPDRIPCSPCSKPKTSVHGMHEMHGINLKVVHIEPRLITASLGRPEHRLPRSPPIPADRRADRQNPAHAGFCFGGSSIGLHAGENAPAAVKAAEWEASGQGQRATTLAGPEIGNCCRAFSHATAPRSWMPVNISAHVRAHEFKFSLTGK